MIFHPFWFIFITIILAHRTIVSTAYNYFFPNFNKLFINSYENLIQNSLIKRAINFSRFSSNMTLAKARLLASSTTTETILRTPFSQYKKSHDTICCSSSNQSQNLALIAGNFETKAQSLAMRFASRSCWRRQLQQILSYAPHPSKSKKP